MASRFSSNATASDLTVWLPVVRHGFEVHIRPSAACRVASSDEGPKSDYPLAILPSDD